MSARPRLLGSLVLGLACFALGVPLPETARSREHRRNATVSRRTAEAGGACPDGDTPHSHARVKWLRETNEDEADAYGLRVPARAPDLDCYTTTKWRDVVWARAEGFSPPRESRSAGPVAIAVMGELQASSLVARYLTFVRVSRVCCAVGDGIGSRSHRGEWRERAIFSSACLSERGACSRFTALGVSWRQRVDPNTTIAPMAVAPLAAAGHAVHVFLTLQAI